MKKTIAAFVLALICGAISASAVTSLTCNALQKSTSLRWGWECHTGCVSARIMVGNELTCVVKFDFVNPNGYEVFQYSPTKYSFDNESCYKMCQCPNPGCTPVLPEVCVEHVEGECDTSPVLVDFDGKLQLGPGPVLFDINADGRLDRITWTAIEGNTAFLALDRNQDGAINDGRELFGNASGGKNGYMALQALDSNNDGWVTSTEVPALLLWTDANADGVSQASELTSAWVRLSAIGTTYSNGHRRDRFGNVYAWKGVAITSDGKVIQTTDVLFKSLDN